MTHYNFHIGNEPYQILIRLIHLFFKIHMLFTLITINYDMISIENTFKMAILVIAWYLIQCDKEVILT